MVSAQITFEDSEGDVDVAYSASALRFGIRT